MPHQGGAVQASQKVNQAERRLPSGSALFCMPGTAIPCEQDLCCARAPRPSRVDREVWGGRLLPVLDHGIDNRPSPVDPIRACKERLVPLHGVVEQTFVGARWILNAKGQIIAEMHGDRT